MRKRNQRLWSATWLQRSGLSTAALTLALSSCAKEASVVAAAPAEHELVTRPEATAAEGEVAMAEPAAKVAASVAGPRVMTPALKVDLADLPGVLTRKSLRVLVPYAAPYYFFEDGQARGITLEMFREYGRFIEEQEGLRSGDLTVIYIPCRLDSVVAWLEAGYGDIAVGGLTVTDKRAERIAFSAPVATGIDEIIISSEDAPELATLDDLAGLEVWVTAGSSYGEHLRELSEQMRERGLAAILVREAPGTLSTEDLFEMVNAGIFDLMVSDSYKAELWSQVLPQMKLQDTLTINAGGSIAWATRRENPQLHANLNEFVKQAKKGTLLGNILIKRYFKSTRWIGDPGSPRNSERIQRYAQWMRELGQEFEFDWLRIAAQCFQESALDPDALSSSGAVGLMQLLPATARDMGCEDLDDPRQNLRAGVSYLDWLRKHYFADPAMDEDDRMDLILAAYNAGPGTIKKWRKLAGERGLDPDRWRDNVELIAHEHSGLQPIRYVANIEKIYVAYSLAFDLLEERGPVIEGK